VWSAPISHRPPAKPYWMRVRAAGSDMGSLHPCDLTPSSCDALIRFALDHYGRLDVLLNNGARGPIWVDRGSGPGAEAEYHQRGTEHRFHALQGGVVDACRLSQSDRQYCLHCRVGDVQGMARRARGNCCGSPFLGVRRKLVRQWRRHRCGQRADRLVNSKTWCSDDERASVHMQCLSGCPGGSIG
jgi:NAD(P)-dependent dehydrogenase (short-subunit alcohol dehydrogenase family)